MRIGISTLATVPSEVEGHAGEMQGAEVLHDHSPHGCCEEEAIRLNSSKATWVEAFQPPSVEMKPARVGRTAAGREPEK